MKSSTQNDNGDLPRFDLHVENELLKLKLKAEFGAECSTGRQDLPDLVVNQFLRSVYQFEQNCRHSRGSIRIYEKVGQPYFRKAALLTDEQVSLELKRIQRCMEQYSLRLDVLGEYPERQIYQFITEEFFYVEIDDVDMPGFVHHFCYEDFHPNHELEIRVRVVEFLSHWFSKKLDEYNLQLADVLLLPDSSRVDKRFVLKKVDNISKSYQSYSNCEYLVSQMEYEWDKSSDRGRAVVFGKVRYGATLESGEVVHIAGDFEFYLSNTSGWWSIYYFVFPGFDWS